MVFTEVSHLDLLMRLEFFAEKLGRGTREVRYSLVNVKLGNVSALSNPNILLQAV